MTFQIMLFSYSGRSHMQINHTEYSITLLAYFILFTLFVNKKLTFIVNKTTMFFGKISYALYLGHQYISFSFIFPTFYKNLELNFWVVAFLIDLPIITCIAAIITYKIEIPYSKLMKKELLSKRGTRRQVWRED